MAGFDTKVDHRDPKTGKVIKTTPYKLRISREHGTTFIRDNKEYFPDGSLKREMKKPEVKAEAAPVAEAKVVEQTPEEKDLGVVSTQEHLKTATKNEIRRSK